MCPDNGLDIAVSAFSGLTAQLNDTQLLVCGGNTSADKDYITKQQQILTAKGLNGHSKFLAGFDFATRQSFLKQLSILCSPSRQPPAYALNVMEAVACGVPFVAPKAGVFTELAATTGAGVLYEPNTPEQLRQTLSALLADTARLNELGQNGRRAAVEHFDVRKRADELVELLS